MTVHVVGTNYRCASIATRERLALVNDQTPAVLASIATIVGSNDCVVLRTCNRVEVYFVAPNSEEAIGQVARLTAWLGGDETEDPIGRGYHLMGRGAVRHLFGVACGLDSMVLGEYEILGQVRMALHEAKQAGNAGPTLSRLFQQAVKLGKRARTETAISSGIFSVGQCAVRAAESVLGSLQGKQVLLFGTGMIAKAVAKHFSVASGDKVQVFSRTATRADELADLLGLDPVSAEELPAALASSDVVIGCTRAPHHVIGVPQVQQAVLDRKGHPLVVIDLGVPRNVDPAVDVLPGIHLFNLDDLEAVVAENAKGRHAEVRRVDALIEEELSSFCHAEGREYVTDLILRLRAQAEQFRQECLEKVAGRMPAGAERKALDYATDLLVRKLLHQPISVLKDVTCETDDCEPELAHAIARVFGLNGSKESARADAQLEPAIGDAEALVTVESGVPAVQDVKVVTTTFDSKP